MGWTGLVTADATTQPFRVLLGTLEPGEALDSTVAFLRWARDERPRHPARVVAVFSGTDVGRLRAVADTTVVHDPAGWMPSRLAQRMRSPQLARALRGADLRRRLHGGQPTYVADPHGARLLQWLDAAAHPVITHLHADSTALTELDEVDRAAVLSRTDAWIAGSSTRVQELLDAGIDRQVIHKLTDLLAYDVDGQPARPDDPDVITGCRRHLLERLGVPLEASLVVGVGRVDWWDVPDAFVRVAWELVHRDGPLVHLVWVPDGATDRMLWPLRHDLRHAGLEHRVHLVDDSLPSWQYLAAADVVLDSRLATHQPAGLREATVMGRPVVRFTDAESPSNPDADDVTRVAHLDPRAMAEEVVAVIERSEHRPGHGGTDTRWHPPVGGPDIIRLLFPNAH